MCSLGIGNSVLNNSDVPLATLTLGATCIKLPCIVIGPEFIIDESITLICTFSNSAIAIGAVVGETTTPERSDVDTISVTSTDNVPVDPGAVGIKFE